MVVHPVIRVVMLVMLALMVIHVNLWHMIPVSAVLIYFYGFRIGGASKMKAWSMLLRMRWFFISILFVYGWLTPVPTPLGEATWSWLLPDLPSLFSGARQLLALTIVMLSVNLLLHYSKRQELLQAIYWLARPVAFFGLSRDRLAVRLVLVLEQATAMRSNLVAIKSSLSTHVNDELTASSEVIGSRWRWFRWSGLTSMLASLISDTLMEANDKGADIIEFHPLSAPPYYQWGLPLVAIPMLLLLPL